MYRRAAARALVCAWDAATSTLGPIECWLDVASAMRVAVVVGSAAQAGALVARFPCVPEVQIVESMPGGIASAFSWSGIWRMVLRPRFHRTTSPCPDR